MDWAVGLGLAAALAGGLYAFFNALWVLRQGTGGAALDPPYRAIREAALAFIRTQYGAVAAVGAVLFLILLLVPVFGPLTAAGFALGGVCSAAAGVLGMMVSVRANVRVAAAAGRGLPAALRVAMRAGSVTGFLVGALALGSVCAFYWLLVVLAGGAPVALQPLIGLGFGASLVSIFARLSGGIFTKAADVGADLVGKIEHGIPEDDARNPATIADNVGDNVGDCAGMAADLFESYAVTLVSAMLVAALVLKDVRAAIEFPFALGAAALLASMIGIETARITRAGTLLGALVRAVLVSSALAAAGFYLVSVGLFGAVAAVDAMALWAGALAGLAVALVLAWLTVYYTAVRFRPVHAVAHASRAGHATNVIAGLALGMKSVALSALTVVAGILAAYAAGGLYGIAVATIAMLGLTPLVVSIDAYGPVTDNAGGIAEMAQLPAEVRAVTDALDAVGNTTKAATKSFAIGAAGLAALVLYNAFEVELERNGAVVHFTLDDPYVLSGLFIGALLPFLFSSFALEAVGRAAGTIVTEVRGQFKRHPDILTGTYKPDYGQAVEMLTRTSIRKMLAPGSLAVLAPLAVAVGWSMLGPAHSAARVMGGMLIGSIVCGLLVAVSMCTGGAAWDNAKKYIEAGHEGGKGSPAHHAAVTGDTVGDPYKDTAGPAINPMIKILNLLALLLVPFLQ